VIPSLTAGTTTSTAATITSGTITNLASTTGTIATLNSTTGTIATLNSTTGTIATLNSTTPTFLGAITASTNTINVGSGQIYKDGSGNVGIGTTSPAVKLHVDSGSVALGAILNSTNAVGSQFRMDSSGTAFGYIGTPNGILGSGGATGLAIRSENILAFSSGGATERLRIASDGQIGIGGANYGTSGQALVSNGASAAPSWQSVSAITIGTAVASTSGTAIDFTGIPSGVKKITVMFNGVSTNGVSNILFQLGTSGGVESTGYSAASTRFGITALASENYTNGFGLNLSTSTETYSGSIIISSFGSNTWTAQGVFAFPSGNTYTFITSGVKTLSSVLDRVRITSATPDTFDGGTVNILYET